jgi:hypothetical protein
MVKSLWNSGSRKEVMDLLVATWPKLDDAGRDRLGAAIVEGPPAEILERLDQLERTISRDRRIFDRLIILERIGEPPLTDAMLRERARLQELYPNWQAEDGERAHFSSWMESHFGPDTRFVVDDLQGLDDPALIGLLRSEQDAREGLLEAWRQLAVENAPRTLAVLEQLAHAEEPGPTDVWRQALWGLRDSAKEESHRERLLHLLLDMPKALFETPEIANTAADILDAVSRTAGGAALFWLAFDRTLPAVTNSPENGDEPQTGQWVSLAINRSLGRLAGAFLNAMFGRALKVGQGIPDDLRPRFDRLIQPDNRAHRLARVIAASRLSYLFAVDPGWTSTSLLPNFGWRDEPESLALWQGFSWQARIDPQLWAGLKPYFLSLFTEDRLEQLGEFRDNLGQILMLVGIEFGTNELPRDETRNAIRAMSDDMRQSAVAWVASYLEQQAAEKNERTGNVDTIWETRVAPWVRRIWPPEQTYRTPAVSEQFGLAAMATDAAFADAIKLIDPLVIRTNGFRIVNGLDKTSHPEAHPHDTLRFLDLLIEPDAYGFADEKLRRVLNRVKAAAPQLEADRSYRVWDDWLRVRGR